jgi:hypothetical protein
MKQAKLTAQIYEGKHATAGNLKLVLDDGRELYFYKAELVFEAENLVYVRAELTLEDVKVIKEKKL